MHVGCTLRCRVRTMSVTTLRQQARSPTGVTEHEAVSCVCRASVCAPGMGRQGKRTQK